MPQGAWNLPQPGECSCPQPWLPLPGNQKSDVMGWGSRTHRNWLFCGCHGRRRSLPFSAVFLQHWGPCLLIVILPDGEQQKSGPEGMHLPSTMDKAGQCLQQSPMITGAPDGMMPGYFSSVGLPPDLQLPSNHKEPLDKCSTFTIASGSGQQSWRV